jgi:16S rRNA (cytosine967-C5)-methyltransferase
MNDSRSPDHKRRPKSGPSRVNSRDDRFGGRDPARGASFRGSAVRSADAAPRPFDPNRATPGSATERLLNAQPRGARVSGGSEGDRASRPGERGAGLDPRAERPVQAPYVPKPRQPPMTIRLDQIRKVLDEVLTWRFAADSMVSHWFREHKSLGIRDRAEVAEAVYDVLRHLRRYRQLGESGVGNAVRRLAIQGAIATMDPEKVRAVLDAGEIAWLDRIAQIDLQSMPLQIRASLPDWLYERITDDPELESLANSLNQAACLDIRVNPLKAERDEMLADLTKGNAVRHAPVATPYSPWGIRLKGRPAMNKWHQFEHGLIEVQDEGSQLLALLVGPKRGEMVIDFCAGAGGKTLLLGALMRSTGRLYAFDVSAARLAKAKPRFARSGLSNVVPVAIDHENDTRVRRLTGKAHRVLVDAPCSGMGTLRRNPDLKWRQSAQSLGELIELQARILASASRCVAPGGRLVYATCSILKEENEQQVDRFLAAHPDFDLIDAAPLLAARTALQIEGPYLKLRPDVHGTDGFFAAVFERRKALPDVKKAQLAQEEVQTLAADLPVQQPDQTQTQAVSNKTARSKKVTNPEPFASQTSLLFDEDVGEKH